MKPVVYSFGCGIAGVGLFHFLQLPLPWLLGPICACLLAALSGVPLRGIKPVSEAMRTILGVAVGASLTPAVLVTFPSMWSTLVLVPVMVGAIGLIGIPYFRRLWGYDFATAYYASMPGGLQDMLVFGEEAGGNVRSLSLIHATRVLAIVVALPFILKGFWNADLSNPPGDPIGTVAWQQLALMIACALIGWQGAKRLGMFGAAILGPLIVTAIVTLLGMLEHRPPAEAIWAAQFFIGLEIGSKYAGTTLQEARRDLVAGLGFCVLLILLTIVFVETIYMFDLAHGMEALLAFAPGGQAELTVLALIVGADMAFVVAHHVLRIFVVILGAPIAARYFSLVSRAKE
ncbi:MAG: AbrB family transcriptional regulator [Sulfitobacter sp.]